jgi:hypothetical protein
MQRRRRGKLAPPRVVALCCSWQGQLHLQALCLAAGCGCAAAWLQLLLVCPAAAAGQLLAAACLLLC